MPKSISKLIISIIVCQFAGIIGSLFTISSISNWYNTLNQPSFRPPNSAFGPVWTILYTLMGISMYWIWMKIPKNKKAKEVFKLFLLHLIINSAWSIVFFGFHQIFLALIVIIILWFMIVSIMKKMLLIDSRASGILFPYLLWVSFATVLNYSIWMLNR